MNEKRAVVLLSGGLDSAVTTLYLQNAGYEVKAGIFVNRGQSNYQHEERAANQIAELLRTPLLHANFALPNLFSIPNEKVQKGHITPGRNMILSALAASYAYALNADLLALGNIISDEFADCNQLFRLKLGDAASQALGMHLSVVAPLADFERWDKAEEIAYAKNKRPEIFALTWSCWHGKELHCGTCGACRGRREGFAKAGIVDAVSYEGGLE